MRPRILLFDEPTSALDPELVGEVLKVILDLATEGRTMLIVTHELAFAKDVSSRVLFLHRGVIEEDGPPEEVFSRSRSERFRQFIAGEGYWGSLPVGIPMKSHCRVPNHKLTANKGGDS